MLGIIIAAISLADKHLPLTLLRKLHTQLPGERSKAQKDAILSCSRSAESCLLQKCPFAAQRSATRCPSPGVHTPGQKANQAPAPHFKGISPRLQKAPPRQSLQIRTMAVRHCDSRTVAAELSRAARIKVMLRQMPK